VASAVARAVTHNPLQISRSDWCATLTYKRAANDLSPLCRRANLTCRLRRRSVASAGSDPRGSGEAGGDN